MPKKNLVLGVDPSSSRTGICLVDGEKIIAKGSWSPSRKKDTPSVRLTEFYSWMNKKLEFEAPKLTVVEIIAFNRSHQTTRILSRYEGATIIAATMWGSDIYEARVSEGRKVVLGKGNLSKEESVEQVSAMYPEFTFNHDEADALVLALYGTHMLQSQ